MSDSTSTTTAIADDRPQRRPPAVNGLPPRPIPRPSRPPPPIPLDLDLDATTSSTSADAPPVLTDRPRASSPDPHQDDAQATDRLSLTPIRAHYLKKSLIQYQFHSELALLASPPPSSSAPSTLSYLGPPFARPPRDDPNPLDLPFLRYTFSQFVLTFPFLASAPRDFFPDKVQPFVASLLARDLFSSSSTSVFDDDYEGKQDADQVSSAKLLAKAERAFALLLNYAVKISEPEQVVRLTQRDLDRLETLARKRRARALKRADAQAFDVNLVSVRAVSERGRVRSRVHEEFIIRLRRGGGVPDVFVSRRYGDFKTLADELRKRHPDEFIRPPPAKDKTSAAASSNSNVSSSTDSLPQSPTSPFGPGGGTGGRLAREKNRLTLRAYLHALLSLPAIASSPVMHSFLTSNPTTLSPSETEDARRREEADRQREEGRAHFAREVAARVDGLRDTVKGFKGSLLGQEGLSRVFDVIKRTEDVRALPVDFRAVIEWGRISLASTVFHHYVAVDDASENFAGLKRIHGLVPYFLLKSALKISNPVGMIRGVLDLFMAQPFGGRSLLQRMFTSSLHEEVRVLEEEIAAVQDKIGDPVVCEKVRQFVRAPREIQGVYKLDAEEERIHILAVVLRSPEEPALNRAQLQRVFRAARAHAEYARHRASLADSDDDDGPVDEDAWLFEDLSLLGKLYARLRDKEQLIELIFEGTTADLLKDIITIFYSPLAQVYRAASIADSIGDLQTFINDLIKTVEATEELAERDPKRTVQIFIDLIERHEQAFYSFVHKVHSKGEGLFTGLMKWIEFFLTLAREGLGPRVSLEFLLPHGGIERERIMDEIDAVALYHYRLKVAYEAKVRKRFAGAQGGVGGGGAAEDEAAQAIVDGFVRDFSYGDAMREDALDAAAEDDYEDDEDEDDDEDEWSSDEYDDEESSSGSGSESGSTEEEGDEDKGPPQLSKALARSRTVPAPSPSSAQTTRNNNLPDAETTPTPRSRQLSQQAQQAATAAAASANSTSTRSRSRSRSRSRVRAIAGSIRRARSAADVGSRARQRTSTEVPPPPVPPLPVNKPLPPDPARARAQAPSRGRERVQASPKSKEREREREKGPPTAGLKPPDLKYISELLPVFVEMMRPHLQPRAI